MRATNVLGWSVFVLCLVNGIRADGDRTLVDTFNEIYDTCLVHLSTDCVQPKALEWFSKSLQKREIRITDDLSVLRNDSASVESDGGEAAATGRDNSLDIISQVDDFLSTHYLSIRYPKAVISAHVPSFVAPTLNRLIPNAVQVPLEEGNPNEGKHAD